MTHSAPEPAIVRVVTFGYLHGAAPDATVTLDLRSTFHDPHGSAHLRELPGTDPAVRAHVLFMSGASALVDSTATLALTWLYTPGPGNVTVAVGCFGGKHRAVTIGTEIAHAIGEHSPVELTHRDIRKDVVKRPAGEAFGLHTHYDPDAPPGRYVLDAHGQLPAGWCSACRRWVWLPSAACDTSDTCPCCGNSDQVEHQGVSDVIDLGVHDLWACRCRAAWATPLTVVEGDV